MASIDLLFETFNLYNNKAKNCYEKGDMTLAKKYYLLAAEQMLKLAKETDGELQKARYKRAKSLIDFAENISVPQPISKEANGTDAPVKVQTNPKVSLEEALETLNKLEGLGSVKAQVRDWVDQIKVFTMRKERGMSVPDMSYHMVFTGNPGTGKTTVARIVSQIYCALGVITGGQLVEVDRSDLVAGYVGQTALKTQEVIKTAIGGVLFIDEAYTLAGSGNDFGQEAIDTILKAMEDNRSNLVVIVAGYNELMEKFINSNPGLKSRFKNYINFTDYNGEQLFNIFCRMCNSNQYHLENGARMALECYFKNLYEKRDQNFGNARDVRNLFEKIVTLQSKRIATAINPSDTDMETITLRDLPAYVREPLEQELAKKREQGGVKVDKPSSPDAGSTTPAPEQFILNDENKPKTYEFQFEWDKLPAITFKDVAGLESVKETVNVKVLLPLKNPEAFEGYAKKNGGGLLLYGPPGTGKTMIAAAIANEIGAKFCSVKPSDLLHQGAGQSEKAIRDLFAQARDFDCAVIYFDEMDSISPKNTKSQYAKQLRSEFLAQLQGMESYGKDTGKILFLIAATNKPWDIDSAFVRPGRFGTRVYVGLPDIEARRYIIQNRLNKVSKQGVVKLEELAMDEIVARTEGYNGSDITNLMDRVEEISILRGIKEGEKVIKQADFDLAISEICSTVQKEDIEKLMEWSAENNR